jgi:preprotein translocase subunit SecF
MTSDFTIGSLMEVVCYSFYDEIINYPQFDENKHCLRFDDIYESINVDWLEEEKTRYNSAWR